MTTGNRLRKLRGMSALELRTRLAGVAYRVYERGVMRTHRVGPATNRGTHESNVWAPRGFLASVEDRHVTRDILRTRFPEELAASLERADRLLAGEFLLFGTYRQLAWPIDWHADPVSGTRWPNVYHHDVPIARAGAPGDAKDVWELNRHQFLTDLARAWLVTERREYVEAIDRIVGSWIEANPYGLGVNWSGPLEVAYRALSWLWACHLTNGLSRPDARDMWLRGFESHGRFLYRHLEMYESPYNHLIGEASVLFMLGTVMRGLSDAHRWQGRGRRVLEERLDAQFYPDGGSVEQATVYHHATLSFYLLAAVVARRNHADLSGSVWDALLRAIEFSMHFVQPDGRLPAIGDNDDARPLAFDVRDNWDFRHVLAIGAVLFRRADFKQAAGHLHEDAFWLLGPEAVKVFDGLSAAIAPQGSQLLKSAGYVVLRGAADAGDYVCFDCGEQAGGLHHDEVASAAHGHADALSVVAHLADEPLLVDAGFYTYSGERAWERYFRETAAHNTVRVDALDQATHLEKMSWSHAPVVTLDRVSLDSCTPWALAHHDGYVRQTGVRHRRLVWLRAGYLIVYDELTGAGAHRVEVNFQFAPEVEALLEESNLTLNGRFVMSWSANSIMSASLRRGEDGPDGGWIAPRLGSRVPAPRLTLSTTFADALYVLTILTDSARMPHDTARFEDGMLLHRLGGGGNRETVFAPTVGSAVYAGCSTDGRIGVVRERGARVVSCEQAGGSFIHGPSGEA
jgi:hypothetical protein